jgi:hypothetical protein
MTKVSSKQASPVSDFQPSVATVEEQGILESFFKLPADGTGNYPAAFGRESWDRFFY